MTDIRIEHEGISISLASLIKIRHIAKHIDLKSLSRVATIRAGSQHSAFRGRGVDFAEVRAYQPGDDIRSMDWRVTARTGKPHTKLYHEEKERPVYFVVDYRSQMYFGTQVAFKSVIAAQVTAMLAWSAHFSGDRVGAIILRDNERIELRPQSNTRSIMRLFNVLARAKKPEQHTSSVDQFSEALRRIRRVARPGSLIFLISDFSDLSLKAERLLSQVCQHNEVMSVMIYDQLEREPPPANRYIVSNDREFMAINTANLTTCAEYRERFAKHFAHIQLVMRKRNIPLVSLATDDDVLKTLQFFFNQNNVPAKMHEETVSE